MVTFNNAVKEILQISKGLFLMQYIIMLWSLEAFKMILVFRIVFIIYFF